MEYCNYTENEAFVHKSFRFQQDLEIHFTPLTPCGNHSVYNGGGEEIMTTKVEDWTRWQGSGLGGGGTRGGGARGKE